MIRTFKIQRTNEALLEVVGMLVAEAVGTRYYVQVIRSVADTFVLIVGDYHDGWQTAHQSPSFACLLHTLRGFDGSPTPPTVMSLLHGRLVDAQVRQDLLETVDAVVCTLVA